MKLVSKILFSICFSFFFISEIYANDPNSPPCDPCNPDLGNPNCAGVPPPNPGECDAAVPIDDYILPMVLVSIGLGYYAIRYKTKKTPS